MPPAKKPNRPMAPKPAPTVNLPAAPEDVAAGAVPEALVAVAALVLLAELALSLALLVADEAALEDEDEAAVSAKAITPPDTGGGLPEVFWPCEFLAAALYSVRVLSVGLQGKSAGVARGRRASPPMQESVASPCTSSAGGDRWGQLTRSPPGTGLSGNGSPGSKTAKSGRCR